MQVAQDFFLKNRLAVMKLARDFFILSPGDQLPTINFYSDKFAVSRGTIQSAMVFLIEQGCISTQFKGHMGTYLLSKDKEKLWQFSGFGNLTGSMTLPLNNLISGLATGICTCMRDARVGFSFAFIQGSKVRLIGLSENKYDFVVASRLTEMTMMNEYPDLEKAVDLPGCDYSGKYVLLFKDAGKTEVESGMTIAADPNSVDQWHLTKLAIQGKSDVKIKELNYISTRASVLSGSTDVTVSRYDAIKPEFRSHTVNIDLSAFTQGKKVEPTTAVILCNSKNYGISNLIRHVTDAEKISLLQKDVESERIPPNYY